MPLLPSGNVRPGSGFFCGFMTAGAHVIDQWSGRFAMDETAFLCTCAVLAELG